MNKEKWSKLKTGIFNRETVSYFVVGVLTTLVDYVIYAAVNEILKSGGMEITLSSTYAQALSWAGAVLFAYIANKLYVFRSRERGFKHILKEMAEFFAARIISGVVVLVTQNLIINAFESVKWIDYIAKIFGSAFNLVFNYVASKLIIFRKKND